MGRNPIFLRNAGNQRDNPEIKTISLSRREGLFIVRFSMMSPLASRGRKPSITLSQSDRDQLTRLADANAHTNPLVSDELLNELDRARVVPDGKLAEKIVRMGSGVTYQTDSGERVSVMLVYPAEADISRGRISILTPIGTALIGLSPGQSIDWTSRDGRLHRLTVASVSSTKDTVSLQLEQ